MIPAKDLPPPDDYVGVDRALISVYDKTGVAAFAERLHEMGVELISTGGTAEALREAGLPVTDVSDLTGVPELLDGRVKSLHPAVHAGILARRNDPEDTADLDDAGIAPIDLVVCNLYPFEEAAGAETGMATAMENVDIGGPAMIRAAAKNHASVGVVTRPSAYDDVAAEMEANGGALSLDTRTALAREAFAHTAHYDRAIETYFAEQTLYSDDEAAEDSAEDDETAEDDTSADAPDALPATYTDRLPRISTLRYGENPHQQGALYGQAGDFFDVLHGKALSFNNLLDLNAALSLIDEFRDEAPTCAILKHTNPCGVAVADDLPTAWERAFATDRQSPYGGIVVVNRPLDRVTAEAIDEIFTEIIIAPEFEDGVMELLQDNERRRLIRPTADARTDTRLNVRSVIGGLLAQTSDPVLPDAADQRRGWDKVTTRAPTDSEAADLAFAWKVVKHVKSNAIVYAKNRATLGVGAGQMSRIDASELAVHKATKSELDLSGSVVASDAFFPFADGLEAAADEGATAAIQPGGSIRDDEVIEAANAHDVAMVMTGQRHFRH
jgi:phosphoribosylaminoimidazolecarboxamide formyltransferase/IMP cyclohydrolase